MWVHKIVGIALATGACLASAAERDAGLPAAPSIGPTDQRFLARVVRRTLEQHIRDGSLYDERYVPSSLDRLECQIVVTLREHSQVRAAGGGDGPIVAACRDAGLAALAAAADTGPVSPEWLDRVTIEIEALGAEVVVPFSGNWTDRTAFNRLLEPGVDGIVLQLGQARSRILPTELITKNGSVQEVIPDLGRRLGVDPSQLPAAEVLRFRTTHWFESRPGGGNGDVVHLHSGLTVLAPDAVTDEALASAIESLARYVIYRQLPSGLFSYQYEPSKDSYTEDDNLVRQAGVAWALSAHAGTYGKAASAAAADLAIQRLAKREVDLTGVENAAFVSGRQGQHKLGITALAAMAMFDHPQAEHYADLRTRLVNGVYWLQLPSGMFVTAFPPSRRLSSQYYFPGEALLLVARDYEQHPQQRAIDTFDSAYTYYRKLFDEDPTPPFAAWHVQAFSRMAARTKRPDYIDFVFEMTDWLVAKQHDETTCTWPELWGGVEAYVAGRVGVATASYLEGFTDALRLARRVGDRERAERYERAVRLAARFVMQLQVRPEEVYYVPSKQDAVGGIRTSASDNRLRIDHCQHALMALIKTRQVLFSTTADSR